MRNQSQWRTLEPSCSLQHLPRIWSGAFWVSMKLSCGPTLSPPLSLPYLFDQISSVLSEIESPYTLPVWCSSAFRTILHEKTRNWRLRCTCKKLLLAMWFHSFHNLSSRTSCFVADRVGDLWILLLPLLLPFCPSCSSLRLVSLISPCHMLLLIRALL